MRLVNGIEKGIVIDHITAGKGMIVYNKLKLNDVTNTTVLLLNIISKHLTKKDIIKIEGNFDLNSKVLGLIDTNITINYIDNNKVIKKEYVEVPSTIDTIIKCSNPRCISHTDEYAKPTFTLIKQNGELQYQCSYCEEITKIKFK
ncbi:MAG: aspartate carbamoyltransferase regulatory subunit [Clostridiales bacterium]|nr:aspartate carbamoyltransferase regulatory subunit [Clostridiales bacterium]